MLAQAHCVLLLHIAILCWWRNEFVWKVGLHQRFIRVMQLKVNWAQKPETLFVCRYIEIKTSEYKTLNYPHIHIILLMKIVSSAFCVHNINFIICHFLPKNWVFIFSYCCLIRMRVFYFHRACPNCNTTHTHRDTLKNKMNDRLVYSVNRYHLLGGSSNTMRRD